jgi:putative membrane protein
MAPSVAPHITDLGYNPLAFQWHPEVWLLVGFLVGAYVYSMRVIGPRAVAPGQQVVSRTNLFCFIGAMLVLWGASDWPVHDISEEYLYSVHMMQHMALSYFMPPLALMATPMWLARAMIGDGRVYKVMHRLTHPVVAAVLFNGMVMVIHIPMLVNASVTSSSPFLHYSLHVLVVSTALLMWMPVCGPIPEFRISVMGSMIYLFLQSVVPTIPAAWLTFAEDVVYKSYDTPVRLWGISPVEDQQMAGAAMKVGGGFFLWSIIVFLFFKRFAARHGDGYDYRRGRTMPDAEIVGHDEQPLTTADVEREFANSTPRTGPTA